MKIVKGNQNIGMNTTMSIFTWCLASGWPRWWQAARSRRRPSPPPPSRSASWSPPGSPGHPRLLQQPGIIVVGTLVHDGAVNLEHPAGEAAVEIKVLEPLPGVARHHLQRNIQRQGDKLTRWRGDQLTRWWMVTGWKRCGGGGGGNLCPCGPWRVDEDAEACEVRVLHLMGCVCVSLFKVDC